MTSISKNVYIGKIDDVVDKINNKCHSTITIKSTDVKLSTCIDFEVKNNDENPRFEVVDHVIVSKYKSVFAKHYTPNWPEEIFVIKNIKNAVPWVNVIKYLYGEEMEDC